ncbi:MAG TPA: glycoside hydrolase family 88 protein [Chitinivibrionales bacterium]|nr:glycoside hydrolase family 88 protein [Chitinivibrionales bacterium]
MKFHLSIVTIIGLCCLFNPAFAQTEFSADSIVNLMRRVAHYRMTYADIANLYNHASAGKGDQPNPYEHTNGGNNWDVGSFMTGLMAMYYASKDTAYLNFAKRWATYFNWQTYGSVTTTTADNFCCTQTYSEIYLLDPLPANSVMINSTKQSLDNHFDVVRPNPCYSRNGGWWWCDALYMEPPAMVLYVKASAENRFLDTLNRYWWSVAGYLYDTTYHFYYRDDSFFPTSQKCPNGKPMFWSCGEAWVIGGLARILNNMPLTYANRPGFEKQFKDMCAAIKAEQGNNNTAYTGLWTTSMLDHPDYPYPESSGSAFFCFAMAWGVRNKLLDSAAYTPAINAAWRDLVKNIGADGRLLRCQHVDWMPRADLSGDINNSSPEGEGAFLQAGYELYLRAIGVTGVKPSASVSLANKGLLKVNGSMMILTLANPALSSLKIFAANGRLAADLSCKIRMMQAGANTVGLEGLNLPAGVYRIVLRDGGMNASSKMVNIR